MTELEWVLVSGGRSLYGDRAKLVEVNTLWWTRTPITREVLGDGWDRALPLTNVSQEDAIAIARRFGARLPRSSEWEWMAAGIERRRFPWGNTAWTRERANIHASGLLGTSSVWAHPDGATPEGVLDVAGNVWEWTSSPVMGNGFIIRGGSYNSPMTQVRTRFLNAAPRELRSPGIGFRLVRTPA